MGSHGNRKTGGKITSWFLKQVLHPKLYSTKLVVWLIQHLYKGSETSQVDKHKHAVCNLHIQITWFLGKKIHFSCGAIIFVCAILRKWKEIERNDRFLANPAYMALFTCLEVVVENENMKICYISFIYIVWVSVLHRNITVHLNATSAQLVCLA